MKHKLSFVTAYGWILLLGALGIALLCFAPREERASEYENRMLQAMPPVSVDTLTDGSFMSEFESYLADAVFGRGTLISVSNEIRDSFSVLVDAGEADDAEEMVEAFLTDDLSPAAPDTAQPETDAQQTAAPVDTADEGAAVSTDVGEWRMYMCNPDGSETLVYRYPESNVVNTAKVLNAYRDTLPEDGNVYLMQIPFAATARSWTEQGRYTGWGSTVEDAIMQYVDDGVYVFNAPAILSPYMEQEQLYFFTDHHWTPRGANRVVRAVQAFRGVPSLSYEEYAYRTGMRALNAKYENTQYRDRLEILELLEPAESWLISQLTDQKRQPSVLLGIDAGYMAFLNGTRGPWRRLVTGYHTGRNALIICDSYGNAFSPYLFPYYDEVHMVDYRVAYYSTQHAGAGARTYIEQYGVDDIYFVLSTASGINSGYMHELMLKYLDY